MGLSHRELDAWERRILRRTEAVPYLLLLVATALSGLRADLHALPGTIGLAALTAAWIAWWITLHPAWIERPGLMFGYFAGLLVLMALLGSRGEWYGGLFAFTGYVHAWHRLPGRWKYAGVTAVAFLAMASLSRGLPDTLSAWLVFLLLMIAIVVLVSLFSTFGDVITARSVQRLHMVDELAEANRRLERSMADNAELQARLLEQAHEAGVREERQRLAREIHDTLAQGLTGIVTQLQAAEQAATQPADWRHHVRAAAELARDNLVEARRSVAALNPHPLTESGLSTALAEATQRWSAVTGLRADYAATGPIRRLHPEIEGSLLRIAQEALTNVGKHAAASRVGVTLSYMEDVVSLDVRDDGRGFAESTVDGTGFGLHGMRQRVERLAGRLVIESEPGAGTAVCATVPAVGVRDA
ncbi:MULTISPECIES: sensor histidine kinase [unclassified Crossiella]|uniref:sensor histidine kinase n=1 Tax=unclassified Crossiella TaxID=2620835 RepID=UPI001FFF5DB3|nr:MULTISPECIES: sensor histidine kinase [unclassified Crossiella]MCK2244293.1 sensor histidine kinase [Crossiella sp. S99.2]MCK2257879.1 sensor histidine kinase [Crossiella sp. S99.1]